MGIVTQLCFKYCTNTTFCQRIVQFPNVQKQKNSALVANNLFSFPTKCKYMILY